MGNVTQKNEKSISGAIKIDEKEIGDHLNQLVRQSVEDTINSLLDAEADAWISCFAGRVMYPTVVQFLSLFILKKSGRCVGVLLSERQESCSGGE